MVSAFSRLLIIAALISVEPWNVPGEQMQLDTHAGPKEGESVRDAFVAQRVEMHH